MNEATFLNGSKVISEWPVGLVSPSGKYLTAESFGYKINASGNCLKKKQQWTVVSVDDGVYLRSPIGTFLTTDQNGKIFCDSRDPDINSLFHIEVDSRNGRWAFKNDSIGYYFAGEGDRLHCFSKCPEWWAVHLAVHPQVNLFSLCRKKYAHINEDEIHFDDVVPWGSSSLLTLQFDDGHYHIRTSTNKYLHPDGQLVNEPSKETRFTVELKRGFLAFKDESYRYLSSVGPQGVLVAKAVAISKDELFNVQKSNPQMCLLAHNGKLVSNKQGVDLSANQSDITENEIYQMEFDAEMEKWMIRSSVNKLWTLDGTGRIQASAVKKSADTCFTLHWQQNGQVVFEASNGKFIGAKGNGHLSALSTSVRETEMFILCLLNRPQLVLRGEHGFVGYKGNSNKLECNKQHWNVIQLVQIKNGSYHLKGGANGFWQVTTDGTVVADGSYPTEFILEIHEGCKLAIKTKDGRYLRGEQSGFFAADGQKIVKGCLWEF